MSAWVCCGRAESSSKLRSHKRPAQRAKHPQRGMHSFQLCRSQNGRESATGRPLPKGVQPHCHPRMQAAPDCELSTPIGARHQSPRPSTRSLWSEFVQPDRVFLVRQFGMSKPRQALSHRRTANAGCLASGKKPARRGRCKLASGKFYLLRFLSNMHLANKKRNWYALPHGSSLLPRHHLRHGRCRPHSREMRRVQRKAWELLSKTESEGDHRGSIVACVLDRRRIVLPKLARIFVVSFSLTAGDTP